MATYQTVDQLVQRLTRLSGQVPGASVQIYSNDIFIDMINTTVRMIAKKYWWPHLMDWVTGVLDGTTGIITSDLLNVQDHTDIKAVYVNDTPQPLSYISDNSNPQRYSGTRALAYEALPISNTNYLKRIIRVLPYTATGTLNIRIRVTPPQLGANDIVPLDQDLIMFGVLWSYFEDEGDNPQQAAKYKALFDAKFTEVVSSIATHRVPIDDGGYMDDWRETN